MNFDPADDSNSAWSMEQQQRFLSVQEKGWNHDLVSHCTEHVYTMQYCCKKQ